MRVNAVRSYEDDERRKQDIETPFNPDHPIETEPGKRETHVKPGILVPEPDTDTPSREDLEKETEIIQPEKEDKEAA